MRNSVISMASICHNVTVQWLPWRGNRASKCLFGSLVKAEHFRGRVGWLLLGKGWRSRKVHEKTKDQGAKRGGGSFLVGSKQFKVGYPDSLRDDNLNLLLRDDRWLF